MQGDGKSTGFADLSRAESEEWKKLGKPTAEALHLKANSPHSGRNISELEQILSLGLGVSLAFLGKQRGKLAGLGLMGMGAALVWRGVTGHCYGYQLLGVNHAPANEATVLRSKQGIHLERAITIQRSPAEIYGFWRNVENLPKIMQHLKSVTAIDEITSHWVAKGPLGTSLEWDAEIFNDHENEMIAWRSLPGGSVETAGSVHFTPLKHHRGTTLRLVMRYDSPAGKLGEKIADFFGAGLGHRIDADLQNFKSLMETGEIATTAGQPRGAT